MTGTRVSDIQGSVPGPDGVVAQAILQGEQFSLDFDELDNDDQPRDTTGWAMTARAEFYLAHVSESGGDIAVTEFQRDVSAPARALDVVEVNAALGEWEIQVPADLYSDDIPINIEIDVPVVAICVTMTDSRETPATIARRRFLLIIRRGW